MHRVWMAFAPPPQIVHRIATVAQSQRDYATRQRVFFIAQRTVSCEISSTIFNSTRRSASSRRVQRECPLGDCEQANLTSLALLSPSSLGFLPEPGFRSKSDSGPRSSACLRHDASLRVVHPYASAIMLSGQAAPIGPWSHLSSACARWTLHAADLPRFTTRSSSTRSSSVSLKTRFLRMTGPP
jgi:hypothetical protein